MTALALTKRTQRGPDDPLPLQRLLQPIRALALSFRLRRFETASYKTRNGNGETKRNETNGTGNHTQNIDSADRAACLRWTRL